MGKGGTCWAHTNAHPRTALPGFDNYSQLQRGSGAAGETREDIWRGEGEKYRRR